MNTTNFNSYENFIEYIKSLPERKKLKVSNQNYICYHKHHIIPRCFGGTNEKENIILLTCKEHIIAHILLCEKYHGEEKIKMLCALMRLLTGIKSINEINLEKIDIEKSAKLLEERQKNAGYFNLGKPKSEETKQKMRKPKSEETKQKMRKAKSEEHKAHIAESQRKNGNFTLMAKRGENYFKGKHHTEECKKRMSEKQKEYHKNMTEEQKQRQKEHMREISKKSTLGRKCFVELATGKLVKRFEHPGEGFVTTKEWSKLKISK